MAAPAAFRRCGPQSERRPDSFLEDALDDVRTRRAVDCRLAVVLFLNADGLSLGTALRATDSAASGILVALTAPFASHERQIDRTKLKSADQPGSFNFRQ